MPNTFWTDFSIADAYGINAIKDTYKRAFAEWKSDYKMLTELVMVLNHKMWQHYERTKDADNAYVVVYAKCFEEADEYAMDNLTEDKLRYFLEVTD